MNPSLGCPMPGFHPLDHAGLPLPDLWGGPSPACLAISTRYSCPRCWTWRCSASSKRDRNTATSCAKRLRGQFGLLANVSFGSIYPTLARLEATGAVETVEGGRFTDPHRPTDRVAERRVGGDAGPAARRDPRAAVPQGLPDHAGGTRVLPRRAVGLHHRRRPQLLAPARLRPAHGARGPARAAGAAAGAADAAPHARSRRADDPELDTYARRWPSTPPKGSSRTSHWLDRLIEAERATAVPRRPRRTGDGPAGRPEGRRHDTDHVSPSPASATAPAP